MLEEKKRTLKVISDESHMNIIEYYTMTFGLKPLSSHVTVMNVRKEAAKNSSPVCKRFITNILSP